LSTSGVDRLEFATIDGGTTWVLYAWSLNEVVPAGNDTNTYLLLHGTGITDHSVQGGGGSGLSFANTAVTVSSVAHNLSATSLLFNGSTSVLVSSTNNTDYEWGSGNFTVESFVNASSLSSTIGVAGIATSWGLSVNTSGFPIAGIYYSGSWHLATSNIAISAGTFSHVAMVRDTNTLRVYVGGSQGGTTDITGASMNNPANYLKLGYDGYTGNLMNGYLDEIRISNICRYPNGTSFTIPSTVFGPDAR
jgi:hypothetical protein